jgi:hypothetical protein
MAGPEHGTVLKTTEGLAEVFDLDIYFRTGPWLVSDTCVVFRTDLLKPVMRFLFC